MAIRTEHRDTFCEYCAGPAMSEVRVYEFDQGTEESVLAVYCEKPCDKSIEALKAE